MYTHSRKKKDEKFETNENWGTFDEATNTVLDMVQPRDFFSVSR